LIEVLPTLERVASFQDPERRDMEAAIRLGNVWSAAHKMLRNPESRRDYIADELRLLKPFVLGDIDQFVTETMVGISSKSPAHLL
jgi:hypothetical protein